MTYMCSAICHGLVVTSCCWMAMWTHYEFSVGYSSLPPSSWARNTRIQDHSQSMLIMNPPQAETLKEAAERRWNPTAEAATLSFFFILINHKSFWLKIWGNNRKAWVPSLSSEQLKPTNSVQHRSLFSPKEGKLNPYAYAQLWPLIFKRSCY